jgi:AcrR family transcriptional regulator
MGVYFAHTAMVSVQPPMIEDEPRWRRRKDARPQEILAAALDLFIEKGYAATRADEVAARAGVSKGTVYLYFENKEELFKAVVRASFGPALQEAIELVDSYEGSSFDLLDELMLGWWQHVGATKASGIMKLMMAEAVNFPEIAKFYHDEVVARAHAMVEKLLVRGIQRGEFRAVEQHHMSHVISSPMLMLIIWRNSFGRCSGCADLDPVTHMANALDLIKRGLAVDPQNIPARALPQTGLPAVQAKRKTPRKAGAKQA